MNGENLEQEAQYNELQNYIKQKIDFLTEECQVLTKLRREKMDNYFHLKENLKPIDETKAEDTCVEEELVNFFELVKDTLKETSSFLTKL